MSYLSNILSKAGVGALAVGALIAFAPVKADAATIVQHNLGTVNDAEVVNVDPLNLSHTLHVFDWFVGGESGTVNIDTYVDPFLSTGVGNMNIRISYDGVGTITPTGSWGGTPIVFSSIGSGLEASLNTTFTESGVAGSRMLTFNWTGGQGHEAFSVAVTAIPVPAAGLLLLTALGGVAALRRRRKDA